MEEKYLVINCGSSSLKFSLYLVPSEELICKGYIEKIGHSDSFWNIKYNGEVISGEKEVKNQVEAVNIVINELISNEIIRDINEIKGIGNRVLHGGEIYHDSVIISDKVLQDIVDLTNLGPLHHPGEIEGIKALREVLPKVKQVAVFDTAFHASIPEENYIYAVPYEWYTKYQVRKYGFHGTSHKYITDLMKKELGKEDVNLIICHVGSGASITCVKAGKSYDTSMGLTPLDGLVMGTRSGSIDPSIIKFVSHESGMDMETIMDKLNKESGLYGICGKNDFRDVSKLIKEGDKLGKLAYQIFVRSIVNYIAKYYFMLDGSVDAIVFTAGVLENNAGIREEIINKLSGSMGIYINKIANENIQGDGIITTDNSNVSVYVKPTDEEVMILRDSYRLIKEANNN